MAAPAIDAKTGGLKSKEFVVKKHLTTADTGTINLPQFLCDQNFTEVESFRIIAQSQMPQSAIPIDITVKTSTIIIAQDLPIQIASPVANNQNSAIEMKSPTRTPINCEIKINDALVNPVTVFFVFKLV